MRAALVSSVAYPFIVAAGNGNSDLCFVQMAKPQWAGLEVYIKQLFYHHLQSP